MSNYYEALRKIMSDGKLKKPKPKIRDRGKVNLEDLIREAEKLDAKGKLSESDFNRIQGIRNEVSNRLLGEKVSIDDIIEESLNSLKKPAKNKKAPDYKGVLPKHMQKMNPTSVIYQAEDQKFNRKMRDRQSLVRDAVRDDYNRLPSETKWDPVAQEETDLLAKYAKEDSLERGRDKLRTQRDILNDYGDIAYKEGYNDPESRRILFNAMDELGSDYEDALKMIKGDISGFTGNPRFANDPMIREAFENYLYEKKFPIDKIEQLNKATSGSIVSNEVLSDREKMLRLLEDIEAQTGIDKMFTTKLRDDASAVGGVIDETPAEIRGMSQMGRRQMSDDLKDKLVAYRTRKGAVTGTDIDDVLLNPYLSNKDIINSNRYNLWKKEEEARLNKVLENRMSLDSRVKEANRKASGYGKTLDEINDIHERANTAPLSEVLDNNRVDYILDQFEEARDLERRNPTPIATDYGGQTVRLKDVLSGRAEIKDDRSLQKRREMVEEAVNNSRNKGALYVRKFTPSGEEIGRSKIRKKDLLKEMVSDTKGQKIDKDLGQSGMNISKWDKPATRKFITGISKQNGLRLSEQMIEEMLKMTKQEVMDFIDNISNPG